MTHLASRTNPDPGSSQRRAPLLGLHVAIVLFAGSIVFAPGCDSSQHLAGMNHSVHPELASVRKGESRYPEGWRKTAQGWEHTSTWALPSNQTINDLIAVQVAREPVWARRGFESIRALSPITIALCQIWAIAIICRIAQWKRLTS